MPISSSSTSRPMPIVRMVLPADCNLGGNRILMAAFFRNPSGRPVDATAFPVLTLNASLSPEVIRSSLKLSARGFDEPSAASAVFFRSSSGDWARQIVVSVAGNNAARNRLFMVVPHGQLIGTRSGGQLSLEQRSG